MDTPSKWNDLYWCFTAFCSLNGPGSFKSDDCKKLGMERLRNKKLEEKKLPKLTFTFCFLPPPFNPLWRYLSLKSFSVHRYRFRILCTRFVLRFWVLFTNINVFSFIFHLIFLQLNGIFFEFLYAVRSL